MRRLTLLVSALLLCTNLAPAQDASPRSIESKMRDIIDPVDLDASAQRAFEWWSRSSDIPLIMNWQALANEGIDPERRVEINMRHVPSGQLLGLLMKLIATEEASELIFETTPWYVQVMTKNMANKQTVLRVYNVGDLLHEVPVFDDAPTMDLNQSLSNTNSGGSGGGGAARVTTTIFDDVQRDEPRKTKSEKGQEIAELIRQTIEPDRWTENGGQYASCRYYQGRLIVNAPLYVHAQIGYPEVSGDAKRRSGVTDAAGRTWTIIRRDTAVRGPAAVQEGEPHDVAGKANR